MEGHKCMSRARVWRLASQSLPTHAAVASSDASDLVARAGQSPPGLQAGIPVLPSLMLARCTSPASGQPGQSPASLTPLCPTQALRCP